jgi:hypothetical protein
MTEEVIQNKKSDPVKYFRNGEVYKLEPGETKRVPKQDEENNPNPGVTPPTQTSLAENVDEDGDGNEDEKSTTTTEVNDE